MNVQTYRAATMREALDLVRNELGGDAIVLSTRQVQVKRRFPWQRARCEAEVVAGLAEQTAPLRSTAGKLVGGNLAVPHRAATDADRPILDAPSDVEPGSVAASSTDSKTHHFRSLGAPRDEPGDTLLTRISRGIDRRSNEVPDELFHEYMGLIDAEVAEDDARSLIVQLKSSGEDSTADCEAIRKRLATLVESAVPCTGGISVSPGTRRVVALVGPTGVGKTTSIAKLAANFKLRDGYNVGLVTVDTYRVAAVDQLRTYAEIIDLPMCVVSTAREMRQALDQLSELDLVLIDTAGRSPRDELKIHELKTLLAEAGVDEVHLVLSAASSIRSLEHAAQRFATVAPTAVLLTKLDEVGGLGSLFSAARRVALPVSYFTTGQDVPDDIEAAQPGRAAGLILGTEDLFRQRPAT